MFKLRGHTTQKDYQKCLKKSLCEDHLKEILESEFGEEIKDEFPKKAFMFVRINILYPLIFKKPPKCEKIKKLMDRTAPIAKLLYKGEISEAAEVILVMDSIVIFTLCQLSKICCIGALFHTIKKESDDPNLNALQNLLVERINTNIRHLLPILHKNFIGCDMDIIKATHCITLLFIRKFCNKSSLKLAVEAIEKDIKDNTNHISTTVLSKEYHNRNYQVKQMKCVTTTEPYFYSNLFYLQAASSSFGVSNFKAAAMYCYLCLSLDDTCTKAYFIFVRSLINLNLFQEAFEIGSVGRMHGKSDTFFVQLNKSVEEIVLKHRDKIELSPEESENLVNEDISTDKRTVITNGKTNPELVDSDSPDSDIETVEKHEFRNAPQLVDDADSDNESETMDVPDLMNNAESVKKTETMESLELVDDADSITETETMDAPDLAENADPVKETETMFQSAPKLVDDDDSVKETKTMGAPEFVDDADSAEEAETMESSELMEDADFVKETEVKFQEASKLVDDADFVKETETMQERNVFSLETHAKGRKIRAKHGRVAFDDDNKTYNFCFELLIRMKGEQFILYIQSVLFKLQFHVLSYPSHCYL